MAAPLVSPALALKGWLLVADFFSLATPAPLPRGPLWERLLLEDPLGLVAGLVLGAVVAFVVLNRRGRARSGAAAAGGLLVLAAGAWLAAHLVETPREAMTRQTVALVGAAAKVNAAALDRLLADDARLYSRFGFPAPRVPTAGLAKAEIIRQVRASLGEDWPIREHSIREVQASLDSPTSGRSQVLVQATGDRFNFPFPSWWLIHWRKDAAGGWRAVSIEPLEIPGIVEGR